MKYLKSREVYLASIQESLTNETTWGGSLLGRMVNSIIRKAKIGLNYGSIKSIVKAIESELNELISDHLPENIRHQVVGSTIQKILLNIFQCVNSTHTDEDKKIMLLDRGKEIGLINTCLKYLKLLPYKTDLIAGHKEELIVKLEKFLEAIKAMP